MKRIDLKGGVFIPLLLALAPTPSAQAGSGDSSRFCHRRHRRNGGERHGCPRPVSRQTGLNHFQRELAENRANSALSGSSRLDEIAARGVLRVGLSGDYEPFSIGCWYGSFACHVSPGEARIGEI